MIEDIRTLNEEIERFYESNRILDTNYINDYDSNFPSKIGEKFTFTFDNYVKDNEFVSGTMDLVVGEYYKTDFDPKPIIRRIVGYGSKSIFLDEYNPHFYGEKIITTKSSDHRDFELKATDEEVSKFNTILDKQVNAEEPEHYVVMDKDTGDVWSFKTKQEMEDKYRTLVDGYSANDMEYDVRMAYVDEDGNFKKWF